MIHHYIAILPRLLRVVHRQRLVDPPEFLTLRKTLISRKEEILNYFEKRIPNAITEGFSRVASLVKTWVLDIGTNETLGRGF